MNPVRLAARLDVRRHRYNALPVLALDLRVRTSALHICNFVKRNGAAIGCPDQEVFDIRLGLAFGFRATNPDLDLVSAVLLSQRLDPQKGSANLRGNVVRGQFQ